MATVQSIVDKIDTKIDVILDNPDDIASYRMGDKSVSKYEIIDQLRKLREHYAAKLESEPYEDIRHIAFDLSDIGEDESEYVGDGV